MTAPARPHHVETFLDVEALTYGWQCFDCPAERTGFRWFGDAEDAGIRHADAAVEVNA